MRKDLILSIDIGTSSCKTVLFQQDGTVLCSASREHKTVFRDDGGAEQLPEEWWLHVIQTVQEILGRDTEFRKRIGVIGVDSQSSSVIAVSKEGKVLYPAMIWSDRRAEKETKWIDREIGQEIITKINGNRNNASNAAPKILWFQQHFPRLYEKTYQFLTASGYLVYRLTGIFSCNISEGGLTQLLDIDKGIWSEELFGAMELDIKKMPQLFPCYEIAGKLTMDSSVTLGLQEGVPVVTGAVDAVACGLGCGIIRDGDAYITGGTVTAVGVCTEKPLKDGSVHVYHHIVPGHYCNMAGVDFGGGNYRWFRDQFMQDVKDNVYDRMNEMAAEAGPGAGKLLFLPTTVGQRCPQWDGNMKGVFFGVTPQHEKKHFIRAIMEGNAFETREIIELMESLGAGIRSLTIAGGIVRSEEWMRIFADVLGKPLYITEFEEATAMGNMLNAAYGVGMLKDFQDAKKIIKSEKAETDEQGINIYKKLYPIYRRLYPVLRESFSELARV